MIAHGKDIKIFSGTSNRPLAEAICKEVGTEPRRIFAAGVQIYLFFFAVNPKVPSVVPVPR